METVSVKKQYPGKRSGKRSQDSQAGQPPPTAAGDPLELGRAIDSLPELERLVLSLHYCEELNFEEIGQVLDLKRSRISSIHKRAIYTLKTRCSVS